MVYSWSPRTTEGGGRAVIDCSKPKGKSVNDYTKSVCNKFSYLGAGNMVEMLEKNDHLCSIDIKDAYRAVSIHLADCPKQGIKWRFGGAEEYSYMIDNRLCMGLSSSPFIFSKILDFVVRCALREGVDQVVNYLDDFCIVGTTVGSKVHSSRIPQIHLSSLARSFTFSRLVYW